MLKCHTKTMALMIAFALIGPSLLHAQAGPNDGQGGGQNSGDGHDSEPESYPTGGFSPLGPTASGPNGAPAINAAVLSALKATTFYCKQVQPKEYLIHCLAERLGQISKQLRGQKEFDEVRAVLDETSRKLNAIARQNRSATLTPARFSTKGQTSGNTTRNLVPVDTAKMKSAMSQALAVIDEAETTLLRSAEQSADRAVQFQRIAAAVGSNKVLLRST